MLMYEYGWHVENVHGNQFSNLPFDCIATHSRYSMRCIEFKVVEDSGAMKFTTNQKNKLPIWAANGGRIWVVAGHDFRGRAGMKEKKTAYNWLFDNPNSLLMLNPELRKLKYASLFNKR